MAAASQNRLSLFSLPALVIGSMIGAGIFSFQTAFAVATASYAALIASRRAASGMVPLPIRRERAR